MTSASYRSPVRPHSRWVTKVGRSPPVHAALVKSLSLTSWESAYSKTGTARQLWVHPIRGLRRSTLRQSCKQTKTAAIAAIVEMHQVARAVRRSGRKVPAPGQLTVTLREQSVVGLIGVDRQLPI